MTSQRARHRRDTAYGRSGALGPQGVWTGVQRDPRTGDIGRVRLAGTPSTRRMRTHPTNTRMMDAEVPEKRTAAVLGRRCEISRGLDGT